jgi:NADH-quinone oxidoreductase subunit C
MENNQKSQWLLRDELRALFQKFPNAKYAEAFEQGTVRIQAQELENLFDFLKTNSEYPMEFLMDVTAVDYLGSQWAEQPNLTGREETPDSPTRFDVVYHFYSYFKNKRLRVITTCGGESPEVPSSYRWWRAAHFQEREVWDMFGIKFTNHPNLHRLLLYEEFEGFPLRKDYPKDAEQPRIPFRNPEKDND